MTVDDSLLFNNVNHADKSLSAKKEQNVIRLKRIRQIVVRDRRPDPFGLYGQAIKRIRWMPWQPEAMKDVEACDKVR